MHDKSNSLKQIWSTVKKQMRDLINDPETYERWIENIVPLSADDEKIILGVSDEFTSEWIRAHFGHFISSAISKVFGKNLKLKYETGHAAHHEEHTVLPADSGKRNELSGNKNTDETAAPNCNSLFTFSNFVVGPENRIAYAASMGMVDTKSSALSANPLFIYGSSGLGKTHLLQAVANEAIKRKKHCVVEYVTCEEMMNIYVDSLRANRHYSFRNRFRKVDYLLIDDIHFLGKKSQMQEEFFNTFNCLHNVGNKILLTSDKRPSEIEGLEERLVSRFSSGLTVEIEPFGEETRLAILRKKQEGHLIKFDDDVLAFIATNIASDVRNLEGALRRLIMYASLDKRRIDVEMAKRILNDYLEQEAAIRLSVETIQKKVAEYYDLRVSDITGGKRPNNIAIPRMIAMYLCRRMTEKSLPEIGDCFGNRNHATVIHAVKRIEKERLKNENMNRSIAYIERKLQTV